MKNHFYGVYGRNGAGIYDNWTAVCLVQSQVEAFKVKKFATPQSAKDFIDDGMSNNYHVIETGGSMLPKQIYYNEFYKLN